MKGVSGDASNRAGHERVGRRPAEAGGRPHPDQAQLEAVLGSRLGRFVVVDLEATCWETRPPPFPNEIIEIGAVVVEQGRVTGDEFQAFVRPWFAPELSAFCRRLTSIRQADVEAAPPFPDVLARFIDWTGDPRGYVLASWGDYDRKQFLAECERAGTPYPFGEHVNVKKAFAASRGTRPLGLGPAVRLLGWHFAGTAHRGIDDARNVARLLAELLAPTAAPQ